MTDRPALLTRDLSKAYGKVKALDGLDLEVRPGSVHALLGPNGAGKSTCVHVLTTLVRPDSGVAAVAGLDVTTAAHQVRTRIGLVGQHPALDELLHGLENLIMFGRLVGMSSAQARARGEELLSTFGLAEAGGRKVATYSGGMRRRLDIAVGLLRRPEVLFLDEPTTGLDPRGRSDVWHAVRQVVAQGTTVLLTTQYLDEADQLADRISSLGAGRGIAEGTSGELKDRLGGDRLILKAKEEADVAPIAAAVGGRGDPDTLTVTVEADRLGGTAALAPTVRALDAAGLEVADLHLRRPTLDEVFLHLTDPIGATR